MLTNGIESSVVAYSNLAVAASKAVVAQQVNFNDEIERRAESTQKEPVDKVDVKSSGGGDAAPANAGNIGNASGNASGDVAVQAAPAKPVRGGSVDVKV